MNECLGKLISLKSGSRAPKNLFTVNFSVLSFNRFIGASPCWEHCVHGILLVLHLENRLRVLPPNDPNVGQQNMEHGARRAPCSISPAFYKWNRSGGGTVLLAMPIRKVHHQKGYWCRLVLSYPIVCLAAMHSISTDFKDHKTTPCIHLQTINLTCRIWNSQLFNNIPLLLTVGLVRYVYVILLISEA